MEDNILLPRAYNQTALPQPAFDEQCGVPPDN